MSESVELSIVMPAYREAESLRTLLPGLVTVAQRLSSSFEIIVSDSMEPLDDTAAVCAASGVTHRPRSGGETYGDAVRSGIAASRGRYVLLMDSDGSHNPKDTEKLWDKRGAADVVIGSRYVKGGNTENPYLLILMSRVLNMVYRVAFKLPAEDVSNSFRLYVGEQIRSLSLVSNNFDIVEEILIRLFYGPTKAKVLEIPMTFEQRKAGESKRNLPVFLLTYLSSMNKMLQFRKEELDREKGRR